jgi:acetyl-CoA synthetase
MTSALRYPVIRKPVEPPTVGPNLLDYDAARATFSWQAARSELAGLPGGRGLNIAHEAVDRHVALGRGEKVALRWMAKTGRILDFTYRDLSLETNRFANTLRGLGVGAGERVFVLLPRIPELYITCLGALKNKSVFSPLFSAFGPEPIAARMRLGRLALDFHDDDIFCARRTRGGSPARRTGSSLRSRMV